MAADSSIDETEAAAPAAEEKPAVEREKPNGPPRPPRPARRTSGSLRIPLPSAITPGSKLGSPRAEPSARVDIVPAASSAPAVSVEPAASMPAAAADAGDPIRTMPSPGMPRRERVLPPQLDPQNIATPLPPLPPSSPPPALTAPALPGDVAGNIEFSLTRRSSVAPPLSFDSEDVDPSDRAPVAPLTPWRDVPPLKEKAEAAEASSPPPVAIQAENDHEDTIVGQVPKDLLELAAEEAEEENTRAYQAPQELIELARREREERRQALARTEQKKDAKRKFADSIPPAARAADQLEDDQDEIATATVPLDTLPPGDAAPPLVRSDALRGAVSADPSPGRKVSNGSASLEELARAVAAPGERESIPGVSGVPSEDRMPDSLREAAGGARWARGRVWAIVLGLVIVVGFALARWGGVQLLSR